MGDYVKAMLCDGCGGEFSHKEPLNTCPRCGGLLELQYDLAAMKSGIREIGQGRERSIWRYRQFLPGIGDRNIVTLGEGCSPLVKSLHIGPTLGLEHLYFKNDAMMPTGSFKDRGFALAVSWARELGVKRGFTYSSGNAGMSFAAYSSRSALNSLICVEYVASAEKMAMIKLYGGRTAVLEYDDFSQIAGMLEAAVNRLGLYQFVNFLNPVRHEAMKTYAYEILEDLGRAPHVMFHPVGTGGGLWGAWKGFGEMAELGFADRLPRMYGVQPAAAAHFKAAFDKGGKEAGAWGDATGTIAQSIACDSPIQGGRRVLDAIYRSGGGALAVTDEEILSAMRDLAGEGIAAEPSAAVSVAAVRQAVRDGLVKQDETVVCVITGAALKQPSAVRQAAGMPELRLRSDIGDLERLVGEIDF